MISNILLISAVQLKLVVIVNQQRCILEILLIYTFVFIFLGMSLRLQLSCVPAQLRRGPPSSKSVYQTWTPWGWPWLLKWSRPRKPVETWSSKAGTGQIPDFGWLTNNLRNQTLALAASIALSQLEMFSTIALMVGGKNTASVPYVS